MKSDMPDSMKYEFPLNENSRVMDVGGYRGDWSAKIVEMYNPHVRIFEPVPEYCRVCQERFVGNPKVFAWPAGLSSKNSTGSISVDGEASSLFKEGISEHVVLWDVEPLVRSEVDLISINAEGAEFLILPRLIETGKIKFLKNVQIQFHEFYPDAKNVRHDIRKLLSQTHEEIYNWDFAWEAWRRKE